jgi:flagellar biosynthetic protein FliO
MPELPSKPESQPESVAQASTPAPSPAEVLPQSSDDFAMLRALGGIGIVFSLMIGGFFALRKFAPNLIQKPPAQKTQKVVETLQMGDKRSISIVQVGDRRLLLGSTGTGITLLATLEGTAHGESAGVPTEVLTKRAQAQGGFRNVFELEKNPTAARAAGVPKTIAPNIRAKMRQLRESLEE